MPFEAPIHYIRRTSRAKRSLYVEMLKKMCFFKICRFLRQISLTFHIPFNSTFLLKSTHIVIFLIKRLFFSQKRAKSYIIVIKRNILGYFISHILLLCPVHAIGNHALRKSQCNRKSPRQNSPGKTKCAGTKAAGGSVKVSETAL